VPALTHRVSSADELIEPALLPGIGAVEVELSADDLREINAAASKITVEGERYPEELQRMTGL